MFKWFSSLLSDDESAASSTKGTGGTAKRDPLAGRPALDGAGKPVSSKSGNAGVLRPAAIATTRTVVTAIAKPAILPNPSDLIVLSGDGQEYELPDVVKLQCVFCKDERGATYELQSNGFRADVANKYVSARMRFGKTNPSLIRVDASAIALLYKANSEKTSVQENTADLIPIERARSEFLQIINEAIKERAVDVHFVVRGSGAKVLFRINGKIEVMHQFAYSRDSATGLLGAIYGDTIDSTTQSFSPRAPSSCTIKYTSPPVALRWQTVPTGDAQGNDFDVVFRVTRQDLSSNSKVPTLAELGYTPDQVEMLRDSCNSKGGIFMSGITGSGKTTALRALMSIVRDAGETKIYTVEDPIELKIFGATQINVRGGSMSETIKSLMRGDPDTIMVGEIRGKEVADAMQDVIRSGHKLLTTIHASSAMGIISRLSSDTIGVNRETLAEPNFISCLVYQYLMPVLCQHCKIPALDATHRIDHLSHHLFSEDRYGLNPESVFLVNHSGCEHCRKGISGMTICAETVRLTDDIAELLRDRHDAKALHQYRLQRTARFDDQNMAGKTSYEAAIYKISAGLIDPNDVNTMCGSMSLERIVKGPYG